MKTYTLAVIGCGGRGCVYAVRVAKTKKNFVFSALCDSEPSQMERLQRLASAKVQALFTDEEEFFKEKRADALIIATPDRDHVPQAIRAMRLGYDILLEKPISDSREEIEELLKVQEETGRQIIVCHVLRYGPGYQKCAEILESGKLGKLYAIDASERVAYWHWAQAYVEGYCTVKYDDVVWENVGNRDTVFDNKKAVSFYMPIEQTLTIVGNGHAKIAVCGAVVNEKTEPQLLPEEHVVLKTLGEVPYERETSFIIDGNSNAKVLTVGESYVTPGNWAGFPPHKHYENNMPAECVAEEIYYFLFNPEQGFAVQCLYTADGEVDEAYRVKSDDLVEFPYGYHATVGTPGYQTYLLWLMAGDYQGFNRSNDPNHAWILG